MSKSELFNISSLVLGIIAWLIPIVHIFIRKKISSKISMWLVAASFTACAFSLCFQIMEMWNRVTLKDWFALEDYEPITFVVLVLIVITIILNSVAILLKKRL